MSAIKYQPELYHLTFGPHTDGIKIFPWQTVQVTVPDCDGIGSDGKPLPASRFENSAIAEVMLGNPVAGPFLIEGAERGDSIAVHIDGIEIDRNFGRTGISAKQIHIPPKLLITEADYGWNVNVPKEISFWEIDREHRVARLKLENSSGRIVEIPLAPFIGCLAVTPPNNEFIHSLKFGPFGGNLDIPGLIAGSVVHLPVFADGAFLFMGDIHAAQGDGEIIGGGIEVSGTISFHVDLCKNKKLNWPRMETEKTINAIGTGENIHRAMEIAYAQLIIWLYEDYGFDRWDAMRLISQTVTAKPGNFQTAICSMSKKFLTQILAQHIEVTVFESARLLVLAFRQ